MLPVPSLADLVAAAGTVGTGIRVNGDRIAVLSNGRGIGEVAGDLVLREGGQVAQLADATLAALDGLAGDLGRRNPVNLFADATAARYRDALGPLLADPASTPSSPSTRRPPSATPWTRRAPGRQARPRAQARRRRLARTKHTRRNAPAVRRAPHPAARRPGAGHRGADAVGPLSAEQDMLMETPASVPELFERDAEQAREISRRALADGRNRLSEAEALQVVAAYGIPVAASHPAATAEEAARSPSRSASRWRCRHWAVSWRLAIRPGSFRICSTRPPCWPRRGD